MKLGPVQSSWIENDDAQDFEAAVDRKQSGLKHSVPIAGQLRAESGWNFTVRLEFAVPKYEYRFQGKGLSVKQPYASAIAFGGKNIENRSWQTHYRGPIAIHASAKIIKDDVQTPQRQVRGGEKRPLVDWINRGRKRYGLDSEDQLGCSQIVAIGMLVDCIEKSSSPWFQGEWGWVIVGIIPISPISWTGGLGLWDCKFKYHPLVALM